MTSIKLDKPSPTESFSSISSEESTKVIDSGKKKEIYFLILYRRKEKEGEKDFVFIKCDEKPKNIYTKEIKGEGQNKIYFY